MVLFSVLEIGCGFCTVGTFSTGVQKPLVATAPPWLAAGLGSGDVTSKPRRLRRQIPVGPLGYFSGLKCWRLEAAPVAGSTVSGSSGLLWAWCGRDPHEAWPEGFPGAKASVSPGRPSQIDLENAITASVGGGLHRLSWGG